MSDIKRGILMRIPDGRLIQSAEPVVMGILNITPDSFFEGSRYQPDSQQIVDAAGKMLADGAVVLDIGGYSTRPDAAEISVQEETDRVLPAIEAVLKTYSDAVISVDTFRSAVAQVAVKAGATMVNDIAGGNLDPLMFQTVASLKVPYILMHSRGTPQTMMKLNQYDDLTLDVLTELQQRVAELRRLGVKDIIIDPGFGFAKNPKQGFEMMRNLSAFQVLGLPMLVGISRKSMIWRTLGITAAEALNGTTALNMVALQGGASILRVHDVKEAVQTIRLYQEIYGSVASHHIAD